MGAAVNFALAVASVRVCMDASELEFYASVVRTARTRFAEFLAYDKSHLSRFSDIFYLALVHPFFLVWF